MNESTKLHTEGFITDEQLKAIQLYEENKPLSIHWELRTILYLGILLLTSGISILIYLNIDTIGHQAVLAIIAAACAGCFYYTYKNRLPYSNGETNHASPFFDYIMLLGCLLVGIFIGYIQFQYNLFGLHYGIATLIPTVLFFYCAYLFDHKGVLSLAITGLAGWVGLSVTPMQLLNNNDFSSSSFIYSAIILGAIITATAYYCDKKSIKKDFSFTYNNFSSNMLFVATLVALFSEPLKLLSFILLAGLCFYFIRYAIQHQSFLFLLLSVIYGYIGITYCIFSGLDALGSAGEFTFLLGTFYLFASCGGIISFFIYYKKILGIKK